MTYKLIKTLNGDYVVLRDGKDSIPFNIQNTDYQEYLKWLAEGNTPEPADQGE